MRGVSFFLLMVLLLQRSESAVNNSSSPPPSLKQCVFCDLLMNALNFVNDATYSGEAESGLRGLIEGACSSDSSQSYFDPPLLDGRVVNGEGAAD